MFRWLRRLIDWVKGVFANSRVNQKQVTNSRFTSPKTVLYTAPDPDTTGSVQDIASTALTIRIIGPRDCGKTTYLGAILACPNRSPVIKSITAVGQESQNFETEAINVLADGGTFYPSQNLLSFSQLNQIRFNTIIDPGGNYTPISMTIFSRDYSGEVIDDFELMDEERRNLYMTDCENAQGILLLLDAIQHTNDFNYAISVKRFIDNLVATKSEGWEGRIALGLTKCEDLQIYVERKNKGSEGLIKRYFPKTLNALRMACYNRKIELGYFSMSAFGMRGTTLEENVIMKPNSLGKKVACVRFPKIWKPFGLFAPLYWLATGDRFPPQHED